MPTTYKHAVSVSGQVFFCAAPIRLDTYDGCQFGCVYCFSRRRARRWASKGVHQASPAAFRKRLQRIADGNYSSALDEFLAARVPLQLGGMHDPFTPREQQGRITLEILRILCDASYPTLISTKGDLVAASEYVSILREMNVVVRLSASGIAEKFRSSIDRNCSTFARTIEKIARLSSLGIATALRIQPVIPGFEEDALRMLGEAASAGVRQVSFEYLKLPKESLRREVRTISEIVGFDILEKMKASGLAEVGWDYGLTPIAKRTFVRAARMRCHDLAVSFGAGDTEFIPWSDGDGCCGSSSRGLDGATQFKANYVGAIKSALETESRYVQFQAIKEAWSPKNSVSSYLDSRSRIGEEGQQSSDWLRLVAARWNGDWGPYSPSFFDGVKWTGKIDAMGFRIYDATALADNLSSTH